MEFEEFLKLIPDQYNKEDTIKFLNCFKPVYDYINGLMDEVVGMKSISKATGEYLDDIGYQENLNREGRTDEEYRPFILSSRFVKTNAPTTANLVQLVKNMTGFYPNYLKTNEVEIASQTIKYVVPHTTDLSLFPDLNDVCDAGARIIQSILLQANKRTYNSSFTLDGTVLKQNVIDIEINPV